MSGRWKINQGVLHEGYVFKIKETKWIFSRRDINHLWRIRYSVCFIISLNTLLVNSQMLHHITRDQNNFPLIHQKFDFFDTFEPVNETMLVLIVSNPGLQVQLHQNHSVSFTPNDKRGAEKSLKQTLSALCAAGNEADGCFMMCLGLRCPLRTSLTHDGITDVHVSDRPNLTETPRTFVSALRRKRDVTKHMQMSEWCWSSSVIWSDWSWRHRLDKPRSEWFYSLFLFNLSSVASNHSNTQSESPSTGRYWGLKKY